jgi:hypothetical protein
MASKNSLQRFVCVPSMSDVMDYYKFGLIIYFIDDPVITHAQPVLSFRSGDFYRAFGIRICS